MCPGFYRVPGAHRIARVGVEEVRKKVITVKSRIQGRRQLERQRSPAACDENGTRACLCDDRACAPVYDCRYAECFCPAERCCC